MRNFWMAVIVFLVMVILIWFQMNWFNAIPLFGIKANIGIVFVVALSVLCGQGIGISVGIVYGFLSDILFGKAFGINTLLFFAIGFFVGLMSKGFSKENKAALVMITAGTTVAFELLSYVLFVMVYHYEIELLALAKTILFEGLYNMLLARLLFKPLSGLAEAINKGKRSYYLL